MLATNLNNQAEISNSELKELRDVDMYDQWCQRKWKRDALSDERKKELVEHARHLKQVRKDERAL